MSNNRGITLVSLIAYIILAIMVIGMLTTISIHFKNNLSAVTDASAKHTEFDKLNLQLLKETKTEDNLIDTSQTTVKKVVFSNGNTYTYLADDKTVYLNDNIKIAENISSCSFSVTEVNNRQKLTTTVEIDGIKRITEYLGTTIKEIGEIYLTVTVESGITDAKITANATSTTGDTLYYTLTTNGKTYEKSTTNVWNVLNLKEYQEYSYTIIVTNDDESSTATKEGTFWTKCSGPTTCSKAVSCTLTTTQSPCGICQGNPNNWICPLNNTLNISNLNTDGYQYPFICMCGQGSCVQQDYTCPYCTRYI